MFNKLWFPLIVHLVLVIIFTYIGIISLKVNDKHSKVLRVVALAGIFTIVMLTVWLFITFSNA